MHQTVVTLTAFFLASRSLRVQYLSPVGSHSKNSPLDPNTTRDIGKLQNVHVAVILKIPRLKYGYTQTKSERSTDSPFKEDGWELTIIEHSSLSGILRYLDSLLFFAFRRTTNLRVHTLS